LKKRKLTKSITKELDSLEKDKEDTRIDLKYFTLIRFFELED